MSILHEHDYDLARAMANLVPISGPLLCRDEMEEWSASEANMFEEALEKYGKDFNDIRQDFVSTSPPPISLFQPVVKFSFLSQCAAAVEVLERHCRVLLHVEDDRPIRSAGSTEADDSMKSLERLSFPSSVL